MNQEHIDALCAVVASHPHETQWTILVLKKDENVRYDADWEEYGVVCDPMVRMNDWWDGQYEFIYSCMDVTATSEQLQNLIRSGIFPLETIVQPNKRY